ncbi:HEPN domain-containing protein [Acetobacter okinawensis]|uniref:HEPN domain-containing protein n=1 Tax=Acetobacter okinawensis TaxID=1076594 RepID=UPI0020A19204|nr:HEPN domain-containing protein [Acetobacter okinawensis]MCP1213956.1 HEPN domain-containing protein [Acetobacter okinawensis]
MPSKALNKFENTMMTDVTRIIESHATLSAGSPGKKGLGHLTRGGVLLLCAAWELYLEEVLGEAVNFASEKASAPDDLPKDVKKAIAAFVTGSQHELKALAMAGDGWKLVYKEAAQIKIDAVNTPKPGIINPIFKKFLGVNNISSCWHHGEQPVKDFVTARGDIAHRGGDAGYVTISKLRDDYKPIIMRTALDTDNYISQHLRDMFPALQRPWNKRTP